ncbi:unnamed protein product [Ambrosiozyma monospora]|uniref:Unnamed protein product n=1 Tax=Ambrosiozyma monospora TaxID=43982 RepID=A0ACB5SZ46_AMBMO|nr:unnamed protein product [Ambrosiozyma monospora]
MTSRRCTTRSLDQHILLLNNAKGDAICSSITLFKGNSWSEASNLIKEQLNQPLVDGRFSFFESPVLSDAYSSDSSDILMKAKANAIINGPIIVKYAEISLAPKLINLVFGKHPTGESHFLIQLGHTKMQDVIKVLGPPQDSIIKTKEFKIANSKKKTLEYYKVHNHFKHGLDIVYRLDVSNNGSNVVAKVVIHSNAINSLEFMKYERLNFIVNGFGTSVREYLDANLVETSTGGFTLKDESESIISREHETDLIGNFESFTSIKEKLNIDTDSNKPIFLDRKEYDLNNPSTGQDSSNVFEMINYEDDFDSETDSSKQSTCSSTMNGSGNFEEEENSDEKNWGLSNLYGYADRCVFEVLIDGGILSSLTLF